MEIQQFGGLVIDHRARDVSLDGESVPVTPTEFALLAELAGHPRRAMSSEDLLRKLWETDWVGDAGALQTHVSRLRTKLGDSAKSPRWIITVHGYGYRFEPDVIPSPVAGALFRRSDFAETDIVAFGLLNLDRRFLWAGGQCEPLLGFSCDELTGKLLYDFLHPDDVPLGVAARAELDAGLPAGIRYRMRTFTGGYRIVEALARPLIGDGGRVDVFLGEFKATSNEAIGHIDPPDPLHIDPR